MRRSFVLVAMLSGILLAPIVTWWVVGDMSEPIGDPDYMFRPLPLTGTQELLAGAAATAGLVGATVVVVIGVRRRLVTVDEATAALPLLLGTAFCGLAWREMTAGVVGANIGGGLALLFTPFLLMAMLAVSVVLWTRAVRDDQPKRPNLGRSWPSAS